MRGRIEQILSTVLRDHPGVSIVLTSSVTRDSFILNETQDPPVLYVHDDHRAAVENARHVPHHRDPRRPNA